MSEPEDDMMRPEDLKAMINSLLASNIFLASKLTAIEVLLSRAQLAPPTPDQNIAAFLKKAAAEICNQRLAQISDDNPDLASELKKILERGWV